MKSADEIRQWLIEDIASRSGLPKSEIMASADLSEYALDSSESVELALALEQWLGIEVDMALLWECQSIDDIIVTLTSR
jgi:acyl carrier protein